MLYTIIFAYCKPFNACFSTPPYSSLIYGGAGVASHLVPTFKTSILKLGGILKALLKITNLFPRLIDGVSVHFMPKR